MFYQPQVLKSLFNRYYILATRGDGLPLSWTAKCENLYGCANSFVRGLDASDSYWHSLLSTFSDIDLRHTRKPYQELIADLLHSGRIRAYQVPGPDELQKLASCVISDKKTGLRYLFMPGNACLVLKADYQKSFTSLKDAESFLASVQLTDEQVTSLTAFDNRDTPLNLGARKRLAHALLEGSLVIGVAPPGAPAKPKGSLAVEVVSSRAVSLGPHTEAGYVPPAPKPVPANVSAKPANPPAQSIAECEQRLAAARERLETQGYQPKYSDQEILALAEKGELDDRFVLRFTETKYAGDNAYLGRQDADGSVKFWSTTFNQLENADTDPQTICAVLGLPNYDPTKEYLLVVVDTQAPGAGQSVSIVPTHKKLGEFANKQVSGLDPERVKDVMTPEYNKVYAEHMVGFNAAAGNINETESIEDYAEQAFVSSTDKKNFETRAKIQKRLGANEYFRGDGATENLMPSKQQCGVMETFTYDKSPQTLSSLESNKSAKRIATKPLGQAS